jgi:hypothetical protein
MMKIKPIPFSQSELKQMFDYDADTGVLTRKYRHDARPQWNTQHAGKQAGHLHSSGYIHVRVNGHLYKAHRLIFKLVHGDEPLEIDHINGNPSDNRINNLKSSDIKQNMRNQKKYCNNSSGFTGVRFKNRGHPKPWSAYWNDENGKRKEKSFATKEEAIAHREKMIEGMGYSERHGS